MLETRRKLAVLALVVVNGLAVAQSLVEAQGGRIWVESTLGAGTVFRFTLPLV